MHNWADYLATGSVMLKLHPSFAVPGGEEESAANPPKKTSGAGRIRCGVRMATACALLVESILRPAIAEVKDFRGFFADYHSRFRYFRACLPRMGMAR